MSGDLREELTAAFQQHESAGDQSTLSEPSGQVESAAPEASGQPRDQSGRYAPRVSAQNEVPSDQEQGAQVTDSAQQQAPVQQTAAIKPPVSWKPEELQGWETMAPHHQAAVARREREVQVALSQSAEARRFAAEVQQVIQPHMALIQAEGGTPIAAIRDVMNTAAILRTAPPQTKAQAVAQLVKQFGIDVEMLDSALSGVMQGRQPQVDPLQQVMQQVQQQLAPVQQFIQQQNQMVVHQAEQTLEQFLADPTNEFAMDVAGEMADILDYAASRGQVLSLQDAYKRATLLHPTISQTIQSRQESQRAAQLTAAARNARNAAVSVSTTGAPIAGSGDDESGDDIRSAIGASMRQLSGRR